LDVLEVGALGGEFFGPIVASMGRIIWMEITGREKNIAVNFLLVQVSHSTWKMIEYNL